ncbi:MAG: hypothetical protein H0Z39_07320 [Peptococcaceae bacterium]|nr:hypothetical protein [Peptococcaceae bacterium]
MKYFYLWMAVMLVYLVGYLLVCYRVYFKPHGENITSVRNDLRNRSGISLPVGRGKMARSL